MNINPDQALLSIVFTFVGLLVGIFVKGYFNNISARDKEHARKIEDERNRREKLESEITKELKAFNAKVVDSYDRLKERIAAQDSSWGRQLTELTVRLDGLASQLEANTKEVYKQSGRIDDHMSVISSHIATLQEVRGKLDAVFRYVDAPKRPTDVTSGIG